MAHSENQLKFLLAEDRITYMKWLRGGLLFYATVTALLIFAAFANDRFSGEVASGNVHTAAIAAQR